MALLMTDSSTWGVGSQQTVGAIVKKGIAVQQEIISMGQCKKDITPLR